MSLGERRNNKGGEAKKKIFLKNPNNNKTMFSDLSVHLFCHLTISAIQRGIILSPLTIGLFSDPLL